MYWKQFVTWCTVSENNLFMSLLIALLTLTFVILCTVVPILLQMYVVNFGFTMVMYNHNPVSRVTLSCFLNQALCQLCDNDLI